MGFFCSCHHAKAATRLRNPTSNAAAVVRLVRRWNGHVARVDKPGWRWWLPAGLRAACSAKCRTDSIEIRAQLYRCGQSLRALWMGRGGEWVECAIKRPSISGDDHSAIPGDGERRANRRAWIEASRRPRTGKALIASALRRLEWTTEGAAGLRSRFEREKKKRAKAKSTPSKTEMDINDKPMSTGVPFPGGAAAGRGRYKAILRHSSATSPPESCAAIASNGNRQSH
jgi:hypothetical protein